ncbi:unnamed protein product [Spirodela intermedia]|uniref:Uncharacterized protein n=1 Tax=Spirodela intermedia TaxID=51605 RepID=A0A7I8IHX1_SPIIN|nr:unnamed protein product [Spirodela intermedia]CAA6657465.1 unnamed protein product [Spirodela intermedia]
MDPSAHKEDGRTHKPRPHASELLGSAKVVAGAAKASLRHEPGGVDKGREKGAGKYIEKAEGYLRTYHSTHSVPGGAAPPTSAAAHHGAAGSGGHGEYLKMAQGLLGGHSSGGGSGAGGHSGGGGYGDYIKMAEGLLKKK